MLVGVGVPFVVVVAAVAALNVLQVQAPQCLPAGLRTWDWLPRWMHSLAPADRALSSLLDALPARCRLCCADEPSPSASLPASSESRRQLLVSGASSALASRAPTRAPSRAPSRPASPPRSHRSSRQKSTF